LYGYKTSKVAPKKGAYDLSEDAKRTQQSRSAAETTRDRERERKREREREREQGLEQLGLLPRLFCYPIGSNRINVLHYSSPHLDLSLCACSSGAAHRHVMAVFVLQYRYRL
jgi:hypothetical protein